MVADTEGRSATQIFGSVDAVKLRSSMTLFHRADPAQPVFREVLDRYFEGRPDRATDDLLGATRTVIEGRVRPAGQPLVIRPSVA